MPHAPCGVMLIASRRVGGVGWTGPSMVPVHGMHSDDAPSLRLFYFYLFIIIY